jgi:hypothetical protein
MGGFMSGHLGAGDAPACAWAWLRESGSSYEQLPSTTASGPKTGDSVKDIELTGPFTNDDETWQPRSPQVGYRGIASCPEQSGQAIW